MVLAPDSECDPKPGLNLQTSAASLSHSPIDVASRTPNSSGIPGRNAISFHEESPAPLAQASSPNRGQTPHPKSSGSQHRSTPSNSPTQAKPLQQPLSHGDFHQSTPGPPRSAGDSQRPQLRRTGTARLPGVIKGYTQPVYGHGGDNYESKYPADPAFLEVGPDARVWHVYMDEAALFDADLMTEMRDTIDVLLVFAALFASVIVTFVVQTSQMLSRDFTEITATLVYEMISVQRAIAKGIDVDSIPASKINPYSPFTPEVSTVWINALWFTSLAVSLAVTLLAVLVKQWLRQYMVLPSGTVRERVRIRHYRYMGLKQWHVKAIVWSLPIAVHLAMGIFFIGLAVFLFALHRNIAMFIGSISVAGYGFYLLTTILPLFATSCPYRTPFSEFLYWFTYSGPSHWMRVGVDSVIARARRATRRGAWMFTYIERFSTWLGDENHASLRDAEREKISQSGEDISARAMEWLHKKSSNETVHNIVQEAIGGFPASTAAKIARSLPEGASGLEQSIRSKFDDIWVPIGTYSVDVAAQLRPGADSGRAERLIRTIIACDLNPYILPDRIIAPDWQKTLKTSLLALPALSETLPECLEVNEYRYTQAAAFLASAVTEDSTDTRLPISLWQAVVRNAIASSDTALFSPDFGTQFCRMYAMSKRSGGSHDSLDIASLIEAIGSPAFNDSVQALVSKCFQRRMTFGRPPSPMLSPEPATEGALEDHTPRRANKKEHPLHDSMSGISLLPVVQPSRHGPSSAAQQGLLLVEKLTKAKSSWSDTREGWQYSMAVYLYIQLSGIVKLDDQTRDSIAGIALHLCQLIPDTCKGEVRAQWKELVINGIQEEMLRIMTHLAHSTNALIPDPSLNEDSSHRDMRAGVFGLFCTVLHYSDSLDGEVIKPLLDALHRVVVNNDSPLIHYVAGAVGDDVAPICRLLAKLMEASIEKSFEMMAEFCAKTNSIPGFCGVSAGRDDLESVLYAFTRLDALKNAELLDYISRPDCLAAIPVLITQWEDRVVIASSLFARIARGATISDRWRTAKDIYLKQTAGMTEATNIPDMLEMYAERRPTWSTIVAHVLHPLKRRKKETRRYLDVETGDGKAVVNNSESDSDIRVNVESPPVEDKISAPDRQLLGL